MTDEARQETTRWYAVKGTFFDGYVGTDDDSVITAVSPVLRKFRGKKLFLLRKWKEVESVKRQDERPREEL